MDRQMEARHLVLADRHIAEGEARIIRQADLVERLGASGASTEAAEDFLDLLRHTLIGWRAHRELIVATLAE